MSGFRDLLNLTISWWSASAVSPAADDEFSVFCEATAQPVVTTEASASPEFYAHTSMAVNEFTAS